MADCECLPKCPFFNDRMPNMPALAGQMKRTYCDEGFESCARFIVFKAKGREAVPANLFPNQIDRLPELLAGS